MKVQFVAWNGPYHHFVFDAGFKTLCDYAFGPIREIDTEDIDIALADEMEEEFKKLYPDYEERFNHSDVISEKDIKDYWTCYI